MKTLAIFGDSYGRKDAPDIQERSWVDFIQDTNTYDITNFAETGTNLWFSYALFLKNHQNFDKVIFLVTAPHRMTLTNLKFTIYPNQNYEAALVKLGHSTNEEYKQYKLLVDYYEYIHDIDKDETLHQLMVSDVQQKRPDAIVYPCFTVPYLNDTGLYEVTKYEDEFLGMNHVVRKEFYNKKLRDSRNCHMIEDNNRIVAEMFLDRLSGSYSEIDMKSLVRPTKGLDFYYQSKWH